MSGDGNIVSGVVHGPVLNAAQWAVKSATVHPSMHRLQNALGLTTGLFLGRKFMDILVGAKPSGEKLDREDVIAPLRPFHGILAYNHYSDDAKDRWMKVVDSFAPAMLGAMGAMTGSNLFFARQSRAIEANLIKAAKEAGHLSLDAAEEAAAMLQSKPWGVLSGITSMFGSASGFGLLPTPLNFGTTLGGRFMLAAQRKVTLPGARWLTNTPGSEFGNGPTKVRDELIQTCLHGPPDVSVRVNRMCDHILKSWFKNVTPTQVAAFAREVHTVRDKFLATGGSPAKLGKECEEALGGILRHKGLDATLKKVGFNLLDAKLGDYGVFSRFANAIGAGGATRRLNNLYRESVLARHPEMARSEATDAVTSGMGWGWGLASATAAVGAAMFFPGYGRAMTQDGLKKENPKTEPPPGNGMTFPAEPRAPGWSDSLNGKPLDILEWGSRALNSQQTFGTHRLSCAAGLTAGGYIGMKLMEVLTGRTLQGAEWSVDNVPKFMRKVHKILPYNPYSDAKRDRWGLVAHYIVPAAFAAAGVITASQMFFHSRYKETKDARYLDECEKKASAIEAQPWTALTALGALFATPAGFPFLPFPLPNYGTALGTRFTLMSGREMITPVLGRLWTGNESYYPYGSPQLLDEMIKEAVHNPSRQPKRLDEMAYGVLKPWFENVTPAQVKSFVAKVQESRAKFLREGGVPEELKAACEKELNEHFHRAGLHQTLREIGLDPATASLGANGLSGEIAKILGAGKKIGALQKEFTERVKQEEASKHSTPPSTVPSGFAEKHLSRAQEAAETHHGLAV